MEEIYNDKEYLSIVEDILNNDNFLKIRNSEHHGLSRLDHSLRVSYYSYLMAKRLKLNYVETARAGLLHDFFTNEELTEKEYKKYALIHHKKALANANKYFTLTKREKNIIISHMFPLTLFRVPRYMEAWVIGFTDKKIAIYEYKMTKSVVLKSKAYNMVSYAFLFMIFCCRFNSL
jgi:uncharacterized protein